MFRWLMVLGGILFVVFWFLFIKIMLVLIVVGVLLVGFWIWWEIRELRRVMRKPPS